jgi:ribosomal protein S18 acetylase RimI-like enzyme
MRIRPAVVADIPRLVALWREMWQYHLDRDPRYQVTLVAEAWMRDWFERCMGDEAAVVLVADEPPVSGYLLGLVLQNPPVVPWAAYGHISELAVAQERRRQGIGGRLLAAADEWFRRRGCCYVEANVSAANEVSRAFWIRHGYRDFIERRRKEL